MGLRLPEGLPPIVLELAVGHFPIGDETLLRVLAAEWRKKAKRLRAMADTVDAAASGGTGSGRFDESIRSEASARAQELRDRAATFDSLAAQLDGFADTIELMKLQVSVMAVVLTAQLVVDFMMAGGPGTIKAAAHRARTKVAMAEAGTQGTARIAARAAANRAARQAIPSPRKLLVMGAGMGVAFGGGAPLVAQAIQKNVLNHTADKGYDWRSAGEGALAGLAGGLVGVEVVRRAAPRLGGFVNRAATSMSIRNPLGVRALGTASAMLLGGVSGAAGGILGTAVLVPIPGTQLTAKDWHMGVTTGFFGGALGAGGSAMAGLMGPHTPPGATAPVPVGAPSSGPRPPAVHARPGVRDPFGGHLLRLTPEQQEVLRRGGVRQPDPVVPPARMPAALAEPAPLGVVPGGRHPIVAESLRSTPQAAVTTQGAAVRAAAAAPSHAEPAGATTLRGAGTTAGGHPAPGAPPKVDSGAPSGIPPKLDLTGSGGGHGPAGRGAGDPPESPGQFSSGDHEPGIDADAPIDGGDIADNTSNDAGGSGDGDGFPPMDRYDGFDDSRWPPDRTLTDAEAIAAADAWDARPVAAEDPGRVVAHARTQAQRVESWWYSLGSGPEPSPAQIGLMWGAHNLVGNLEGIPPAVRDTANRIAVRRAVTAEWSSPGMHLHQLLEHKDLVDTADGQMAGQGGELKQAHLLTFVGHPQPDYYPPLMVEIAYGDIATADRVGVHAMSSVSGAEAIARRMPDVFGHFDQANAGSESVALVVRNHSETLPIPGVAPERETSRLLDERAGISLLNALAARHAGTGEVHVVAYSSMSDAVGWASRFGSLGEAGVVRISFPHVMPAGLLEHAAQLGVDQVFADPNTRTDHVAAAMDTDFGAGMVAELSPSTLADITLGRLDRVPVQLSEQMLLDRVQDRLDTGRLSRFLRTLDLAGAPPDRFGAGAAAMRTARTCDMAREMGLSDARIRQLLVEGTLGPGAAEVPGVPWHLRHDIHQRAATAWGEAAAPAALAAAATGPARAPSVYVLGANMVAIGPELPHTVAVYVGDGTMAEVGVRAAELHRMIMQAHPDQSVTVIGCTASGHDGSGLALQLAGLDGELGYRATVAHVSAPRIHLIGEGLDGAATAAAAAVHGRLQYLAASLTLVDPPAGMDHSQYYVPAHFMSRDGVPAPPLGGGRRLGWSAGTFADIVAGNGDVVPALPDPNLGRPGPREVNELFDYRRWPTARHPTGEQVAQAEAAWRTCPTRDLPTDPREVAAVGRSQGTEVAAWWNSLGGDEGFSAAQIGLLRGEHGAQLARMEGLPPEVRDAANRIMLRRWIAEEWDNPGAADGPGLSDYLAYKDLLDAADAEIATVSECREHAYLLTLDLNRTSADAELRSFEIAFGDPAAAHTIGMHLLAPRSGFRETAGVVPEALGHYANLTVLGDGPVSVVVRMYSAPVGDVPHQTRSVGPAQNFAAEGRRLACDIAARQAASQASAVPATHLVAHGSAGAVVGYAAQHGALADAGVARLTFRECETAGPAGHRADLGVGQVFAQSRATDLLSMMEAEFGNNPGEVEPGKADFDARALGEGAMPVELAMISAGLRDYDPAQPTGEQLAGRMQTAMADGVPSDLSGRTEAGPEAVRSGVEAAHDGAAHIARTWDAVRALGLSEEQASRAAAAAADAHNTAGVPWDVRHARHRRDLVAEVADLMHVAAGLPGAPQVRVLHHDGGVPGTMLAFGDPVADSVAVVVTDRGLRDGAEHAAEVYRMAKSADPDRSVTVIVALGNDGTEGRHGATAVAQRIAGLVGEARYRALDTGAPLPQVHVIGEGRGAATVSAAAAQQNLALFVDSLMFVDPHGLAVHADSYGVPVHMAFRSGGESSEVFGGKHIGWNADNVGQVVHGRGDTVPALDSTPPAATSFESGTPWPAHDPSFEPADDGLGYYSRPDLGHHGHADLGTPNDCAVGGSEFLSYWHPGNPEIRPIEPSPEIWLSGVEPAEFAQSVGADWSHRFGSLDDAARYVLKHGGTVTVGVEFHGLADRNNGVGAHIAVFHRSDDGRILVYEKRNGEATSYFHRFGPDAASVKAIYAIVHNQDGSAYQSLADGRSQAVAGLHMPDTNLGAPIRVGDDSNSDAYFDSGGLLVRHPQTSDEVETATVTGDTRPQFPDINTGIHQFRL